jgi:hypothetical protein
MEVICKRNMCDGHENNMNISMLGKCDMFKNRNLRD